MNKSSKSNERRVDDSDHKGNINSWKQKDPQRI